MGRREEGRPAVTADERRAHRAARSRAYRAQNPDRVAAANRRSYERNREAKLAYEAQPERRAKKAARMKAARAADPEKHRLQFRAWNYGLTVEAVTAMLAGGCAVCGSAENLHVDHDHGCCPDGSSPRSCGKCVRGVLCHGCNTALGLLKEDAGRIEALLRHVTDSRGTGQPAPQKPASLGK